MKLTENFSLKEFISSRDKGEPSAEVIENLSKVAFILQGIRDQLDKPIHINSGFRSPEYNKRIGGATNSYHVKGMAADIRIEGYTPTQVQVILKDWPGGLGHYDTFTHIDIREYKARW